MSFISAKFKMPRLYGGRCTLLCNANSLKNPKLFSIVMRSAMDLSCVALKMARRHEVFSNDKPWLLAYANALKYKSSLIALRSFIGWSVTSKTTASSLCTAGKEEEGSVESAKLKRFVRFVLMGRV